jgi:hypothetical protein
MRKSCQALMNNTIDTTAVAASSSSDPTLSLPQSSSTFPSLSNQIDTYRIEKPESFHNSKDDIAD